jgi:uncharacterized protein with PQ loop repeat
LFDFFHSWFRIFLLGPSDMVVVADNSTACEEGPSSQEELTANIIGIVGGLTLALCLSPQVIQTWRTKSVEDVAYGWLCAYFSGLIMNLTYFILIGAVVAYATLTIEISFCITMIILKIVYTKRSNPNADNAAAPDDTNGDGIGNGADASENNGKQLHRIRSGRFQGSASFFKTPSMKPKESNLFRAQHFLFDYTFEQLTEAPTLAAAVLSLMRRVCEDNGVHYTHSHVESFTSGNIGDNPVAPPVTVNVPSQNFSVVILATDAHLSHISAQCHPAQGTLAVDMFAPGAKPVIAQIVAKALHAAILALRQFIRIEGRYRETPRFPILHADRRGSTTLDSAHRNSIAGEAKRNSIAEEPV